VRAERTCAVLVPVYNEAASVADTLARLRRVIARVPGYRFEIVCVDDGSRDGSAEVLAREEGITVLTHEANRGYGAALRTGLDHCAHEWIFITDADGTYDLDDLERLLVEADRGADMVVGAREGEGIRGQPFHRIARWILRRMVRALTGVLVPDLNSGLRVFRRAIYQHFRHLLPLGFSFTTTMTVASLYSGYRVRYLPTRYGKRTGKSNLRPFSAFMSFLVLILRLTSYFEPLRFFVPLSLAIFALAFLRGVRDVYVTNAIGSLAVIMFLIGLQIFVLGVIADVVVKRSQAGSHDAPPPPSRPRLPGGP
jgi:glycosyltransferase involved in cell wall biosynthesis